MLAPTMPPFEEHADWPYVVLFLVGFGGALAVFAAFMFFAIEGWAFAALALSQVFIALGVLYHVRRLHRELRDATRRDLERLGRGHSA